MLKVIAKSIRVARPELTETEVWLLARDVFMGLLRSGWAMAHNA